MYVHILKYVHILIVIQNMNVIVITIDSPINKVTYGLNDHIIDITDTFNQRAVNNYRFQVTNQFAGKDPLYGTVKKLYISLINSKHFEIMEGKHVLLKIVHQTPFVNINIIRLCDNEVIIARKNNPCGNNSLPDLLLITDT